jgi:hypothetical protein
MNMHLEIIMCMQKKTLPVAEKFKNEWMNAGRRCCCRGWQRWLYKHCVNV